MGKQGVRLHGGQAPESLCREAASSTRLLSTLRAGPAPPSATTPGGPLAAHSPGLCFAQLPSLRCPAPTSPERSEQDSPWQGS